MAKSPVQVQKGPIVAKQDTMKFESVERRAEIDYENHKLRKSGQTLTFHTPKQ